MLPLWIVAVFLVFSSSANPIIIRSGLKKDQAQKQDANLYDNSAHNVKGISNFEAEEGFNRGNEKKIIAAQDASKFGEESGQKNLNADANSYEDGKFYNDGGGQVANSENKNSHKKGHHKSGFTKSYHKDESEDNSSYWDDAEDRGDKFLQDSRRNEYGDAGQQNQKGSHLNDRRYEGGQSKKGYHENAENYGKDLANQRNYNAKNYYDSRADQGLRNEGNAYEGANRYNEERYLKKPQYYYEEPYYYDEQPYYQRPIPQRTITIYEDPRYAGYERYPHDDYVQLEYKRSPRGDYYDYDRRPSYDYYY